MSSNDRRKPVLNKKGVLISEVSLITREYGTGAFWWQNQISRDIMYD